VCPVTVNGRALLASGSDDRTMRIWDPATGQRHAVLEGHQDWVNGVCPVTVNDRALLASGSSDRTVRIWDPHSGACILIMPTYGAAFAVVWVADSLTIGLDTGILVIKPSLIT
jgi:WD40 repeat protein